MRIISRAPNAASLVAQVTTAQVFPNKLNTAIACLLPLPGSNRMNGKRFIVRASGNITTGATLNVTLSLYAGTSLTPGSNTLLLASTARALNTAKSPFMIEAALIVDAVSGLLHGSVSHQVSNLLDAPAAVGTVVTALDPSAEPVTNFVVAVTFSVANVANVANLQEFVLGF